MHSLITSIEWCNLGFQKFHFLIKKQYSLAKNIFQIVVISWYLRGHNGLTLSKCEGASSQKKFFFVAYSRGHYFIFLGNLLIKTCCCTLGIDHLISFEANLSLLSCIPFFLSPSWSHFLYVNMYAYIYTYVIWNKSNPGFLQSEKLRKKKLLSLQRFELWTSCAKSWCDDH